MNIIKDLSNADYHARPDVGSSMLKDFVDYGAYVYFDWHVQGNKPEYASNNKDIGTLAHMMLLEPDIFQKTVFLSEALENEAIILREQNGKKDASNIRMTSEYKQLASEYAQKGIITIPENTWLDVTGMISVVNAHPVCQALLKDVTYKEASFFAEIDGIKCKARPDVLTDLGKSWRIIDYKTTAIPLSEKAIARESVSQRRHLQAYFHSKVVEAATGKPVTQVIYINQWQKRPYPVMVWSMTTDWQVNAEYFYTRAMRGLKRCLESNTWPMSADENLKGEVEMIEFPQWAEYEILKGELYDDNGNE